MKKIKIYILSAFLLLTFVPSITNAETHKLAVKEKTDESAKAGALISRLMEIKKMDISSLNSSEKGELRKEVISIKENLKKMEGGIYLSVGAIIIIILLLILLL